MSRPTGYWLRKLADHTKPLWRAVESTVVGSGTDHDPDSRFVRGQCMYDYPKGVACDRDQEGGRRYCSMHPPDVEWNWDPMDDEWDWSESRARRGGWFR